VVAGSVMPQSLWLWVGFLALVFVMLALDLGVFNKKDHEVSTKEALTWTAIWIGCSLLFNVGIYFIYEHHFFGIGVDDARGGRAAAVEFLTGYLIEKSLSLDNIFVIALIFGYFKVPAIYQHRVLFWGIIGALVMRGGMILAGAALIRNFTWMIYVFGGFLIITAIRMMFQKDDDIDPNNTWLVRRARRFFTVSRELDGHNFFTHVNGKRAVTPLFLVLLVVESSDVLFAVDSIPAIFAVTDDPFIVFTSNIFAILGLRSLYFALASLLDRFHYLKQSLVFILAYVGVKMILSHTYHVPAGFSLGVIVGVLGIGVAASMLRKKNAPTGKDSAKSEASEIG
jgi:tellurite resistance protein TerC